MKIKTSKLTDAALDWAVCEATGLLAAYPRVRKDFALQWPSTGNQHLHPATDWAQGGPILTRERISRTIDHSGLWIAYWTDGYTEGDEGRKWMQCDRSELVAGLRCYVASKLGNEVEVPDELA